MKLSEFRGVLASKAPQPAAPTPPPVQDEPTTSRWESFTRAFQAAPEQQKSTWVHKAVGVGNVAVGAGIVASAAVGIASLPTAAAIVGTAVAAVAVGVAGVVVADALSGCYHWALDNYFNPQTPILGEQAQVFQQHHARPKDLLKLETARTNYTIGKYTLPLLAGVAVAGLSPLAAIGAVAVIGSMSQVLSIHKWSHNMKTTGAVRWLQQKHIILSQQDHVGAPGKPGHHHNPFEGGYCLVNGVCNKLLDRTHFFRKLEHVVYNVTGAEANCWEKPEVKALALDPSTRKAATEAMRASQ